MPLADRIIPGVGKIAVLRANAIGDLLLALPALEALQAAYPLQLHGRWAAASGAGEDGLRFLLVYTPAGNCGRGGSG